MSDHSHAAALFGFCECRACSEREAEKRDEDRRHYSDGLTNITLNDWHLFTIRSTNIDELTMHHAEMHEMGFYVGDVEYNAYGVPKGWFTFKARIRKDRLSQEQFKSLCEWDEKFGQYEESEVRP